MIISKTTIRKLKCFLGIHDFGVWWVKEEIPWFSTTEHRDCICGAWEEKGFDDNGNNWIRKSNGYYKNKNFRFD